MIRVAIGVMCAVSGLVLAGLSASALSVVGTEEVTSTHPFEVGDGAYALVLDEAIVPFDHTEATLTVTSDQELFIGTANGVDVDDYLTGIAHEEITDVEFPSTAHHRTIAGEPAPGSLAPTRDWWTGSSTDTTVRHTFDLDAEPQTIVVTPAAEGGSLDGAQVSLSMKVGEVLGLALLGFAGAAALLGVAVFMFLRFWFSRFRPRPKRPRSGGRSGGGAAGGNAVGGAVAGGSAAGDDPGDTAGPRATRRLSRSRGTSRRAAGTVAGLGVTALVLSGCGAGFPQPTRPELTPYERPALHPGEAGEFMAAYSESLDAALKEDAGALEQVQTGPLLERTRAELLIAENAGTTLGAPGFADVRAGGPVFEEYPLWFMAFATPQEDETDSAEAMLVTRASAAEDWVVAQSLYIPEESLPTVLANEQGAVAEAPPEHGELADSVTAQAVEYLQTGEAPDGAPDFAAAGLEDFRDYVAELGEEDTGFTDLTVECSPYDEIPLDDYALATQDGGVSFAEVRCGITVNVPDDYFVDLGEEIEAVMTTEEEGGVIRIDVAQPMLVTSAGETAQVASPGWYMLSSSMGD